MPARPEPNQPPMGGGQVMKMLAPSFIISVVAVVVGVVLIHDHHRVIGLILVLVAALGGALIRVRLMQRIRGR